MCVRDIAETSLSRMVTVAYIKKQPPGLFCEKGAVKIFTGKRSCLSCFLIKNTFSVSSVSSVTFFTMYQKDTAREA